MTAESDARAEFWRELSKLVKCLRKLVKVVIEQEMEGRK